MEIRPKRTSNSHRGINFSAFEDEMLCKAWLETEREPVVLSSQDKLAYWDRVLETFNQLVESGPRRTTTSLMCRWSSIQKNVSKFCEILTYAEITEQNDLTELNQINEKKRVCHIVQGQPFKFETCWNLLKGTTKWEELCLAKTNTKKVRPHMDVSTAKLGASSTPTTPSSTPSTPSTVPFESDSDRISLDDPCEDRSIRRKVEKESRNEECSHHVTKVVEANMILNNFLSKFSVHLLESEEIALRELKLKEQKVLEEKIEKEQKIMDMDLSSMLPMQHDYYLARQREILARWTASGEVGGLNGQSGLQSERNSRGLCGEGTMFLNTSHPAPFFMIKEDLSLSFS